MAVLKEYWVPDYYINFRCKGPDCRSCCCHGWGISLSMQEYFKLLGMDCSPKLRSKLDCSFHMVDFPTEERYVQITPDWRGDCPLHMENGYCCLQWECGEEALPSVCRYYPRSPRTVFADECACSNSCEGVLEQMFQKETPIRMERHALAFELPEAHFNGPDWLKKHYPGVRRLCVDTLQNREIGLGERLIHLGRMLERLHRAFLLENDEEIEGALAECRKMQPEKQDALSDEDKLQTLNIRHRMSMLFGEPSRSLEDYARSVETALGLEGMEEPCRADLEKAQKVYLAASRHFQKIIPDWEILFEHMLVNHVIYESFPFSDCHENLWEEGMSLCAVYAFVRYLAVCWMRDKTSRNVFVDVCAAAFRLIDHSAFDRNAALLLESMNLQTPEAMAKLVRC